MYGEYQPVLKKTKSLNIFFLKTFQIQINDGATCILIIILHFQHVMAMQYLLALTSM